MSVGRLSSFLVGFRSSPSSAAPLPWCPAQGPPPPPLLRLSTSAARGMERPRQDRGPPYKRRKSSEERRRSQEREPPRGGAEGGPNTERRPPESRRDGERWDRAPPAGRERHPPAPPPGTQPAHLEHQQHPCFREGGAEVGGACSRPPPPVKPLRRRWESCSTGLQPPGGGAGFSFSVMSYNILSQELLQDNAALYRHCSAAVLPWHYRLPNLLDEIRRHRADILCLQEVQQDHYEERIKPALQELGYQCEYKKRTGSKPDGCAIVFRASLFSLLSSNPVEFFRPGDALLDRDNVGQVVLLRPAVAPASVLCVANTHLLYNPRRGDVKLAQLAILLAEISRMSRLPDGSANPVVLCGDFNSTPWSPLYRFLTRGSLDCRGLQIGMVSGQESAPRGQRLLSAPLWSPGLGISRQCEYEERRSSAAPPGGPSAADGATPHLSTEEESAADRLRLQHRLTLRSSYPHRLHPDGRPEVTTCHSRGAMTVDYILFTPDVADPPSLPGGRGLRLLSRLSLVGQAELEEVDGLPNGSQSSDHLPLLARFCLQS